MSGYRGGRYGSSSSGGGGGGGGGDDRRHGSRHSGRHDDDVDRMQEDQGDDGGWGRREARGSEAWGRREDRGGSSSSSRREDRGGDRRYDRDDGRQRGGDDRGGSSRSGRRDDDYDRRGSNRRDDHDDYGGRDSKRQRTEDDRHRGDVARRVDRSYPDELAPQRRQGFHQSTPSISEYSQLDIRPGSAGGAVTQTVKHMPSADGERETSVDGTLLLKEHVRPARRGVGTLGRVFKLLTNYFDLEFKGNVKVYRYDVDLKPEAVTPAKNRLIMDAVKRQLGAQLSATVYDGRKMLYSLHRLQGVEDGIAVEVDDGVRPENFVVKITLTGTEPVIDMADIERFLKGKRPDNPLVADLIRAHLQVLDVIFKQAGVMRDELIPIIRSTGSAFYDPKPSLGMGGINAHMGWKQSVRPTYRDLLINIDTAVTGLYPDCNLVEAVALFATGQFNPRNANKDIRAVNPNYFRPGTHEFKALNNYLVKVKVRVNHRNTGRQKYTIWRLAPGDSRATIFKEQTERGLQDISVFDYFKKNMGKTLNYPNLPVVNVGNDKKGIFIPMEFLVILPRQRHVGKLSDSQTAEVIKLAALEPSRRRDNIEAGRRALHNTSNTDVNELYKAWGIRVGDRMLELDARVLPNPKICLNDGYTFQPRQGVFELHRERSNYYRPAPPLESFAIVILGRGDVNAVLEFMDKLLTECCNRGMRVTKRNFRDVLVKDVYNVPDALRRASEVTARHGKLQMVFCFIEKKGSPYYGTIKREAETRFNIMTQCVTMACVNKTRNARGGGGGGVFNNLAIKINAKLGGVNYCAKLGVEDPKVQKLAELGKDTMIIGVDVTHRSPAAMRNGGKSIAAVVASMDENFAEFRCNCGTLTQRDDIIPQLGSLVTPLLQQYREARKAFPRRIVLYRDGVSEGQFGEVSLQELQSLKKALRSQGCGDIKLTVLLVNKRHGTRFFVKDRRDGEGKLGNIPAGTVVDTGVVHPFEYDFYLNSHAGIQGTSRPAHYHVIHDECGFTADELQQLTTRAVSVHPAVYYADKVALRMGHYLEGDAADSISMVSGGSGQRTEEMFRQVLDDIRETMFFS
ncbi:eukaryotic translation initiation factor 2C, 2 [Phlyctochytrium bullatum]|nr:eukaryotic translation initiation factor 2C, 2 [Phlyctochytrium bullatum]